MSSPHNQEFQQVLPPFDELVEMAQNDPEGFKRFKQSMCQELIQSASDSMQQRLRAQQSHIDLILSQCKNPDHANVTLMRELSMQMVRFRHALEGDLNDHDDAQIIPFRPRDDQWR